MTALLLFPAVLSLLALAAHFLRGGSYTLVLAALAVIVILFVRRPRAARVAQVALLLGALEWGRTLLALVDARQAAGQPYTRLITILGSVAATALLAALLIQTRRLGRWYRRGEGDR